MKALVWTDKNTVEIHERDIPEYKNKVLIKVAYAGICGSDVSVFMGKHPRARTPLVMGHEFTGTVEAIGDGVETPLNVGDHVVVNPLYYCGRCRACLSGNTHVCRSLRLYGTDTDGGMAEYTAIPEKNILKLPSDLPLKIATLIEPVAVVIHGFRMIRKQFYGSAAVIGLGPMGLLSALMLKDAGVSHLYCIETNSERAERARILGLEVIDPSACDSVEYIRNKTDGEGVDILVEASGSAAAAKSMTAIAGVRAEILLLSVFKDAAAVDLRTVNFAEQTIIGSRVYTAVDFKDAIDYVKNNTEKLMPVISHVRPLSDAQKTFDEIVSGKTNTMKVLLEINPKL